ncbi:MAG: triose-phosphate isomerase [Eubacteriales bacterium]|nr:triose-phosphate isomerase [Eubacteriales bacterium]
MRKDRKIKAPFFEIGPKAYLYGDDVLELAKIADAASAKYDVDIIFTTPFTQIRRVSENTENIFVFAPHMDPIKPGKGLADILPEEIASCGASGVMLNHSERAVTYTVLKKTIVRAKEVGLLTIVCADSIDEIKATALLKPDIIVAEPVELIGTGVKSEKGYVMASIDAVKAIDPEILVLQGAGIKSYDDVYKTIFLGAEATGSSSGVATAADKAAIVDDMIRAVREAWDARNK